MNNGGGLVSARERSRSALRRGAPIRELQEAAVELGEALCATAEDRELWDRLRSGTGPFRAAKLTKDQATQLEVIVALDWARLLNESGYQPPPPAEVQANELQQALADALNRGARADFDATRENLRALCMTLVEVGEGREVSRRELRRRLRTGVRVSGKLLVVIGAVALTGVAAPPLAAALGVHVLVVHIGAGLVLEGVGRTLEREIDRGMEQAGDGGQLDPADLETLERAYAIRPEEFAALVERWREARGDTLPEQLIIDTRRYLKNATKAFYDSWSASTGAVWYSDLEELFYEVNDRRQRLCAIFDRIDMLDPEQTVDALQRFGDRAARLQAAIEQLAHVVAEEDP